VWRQLLPALRRQPVAAARAEFRQRMRISIDARRAVWFAEAGFTLLMLHWLLVELFVPERAAFGGDSVAAMVVLGAGVLGMIVFGTWVFARVGGACSVDRSMPFREALRDHVPPAALLGLAASQILLGGAVILAAFGG
jgi:hypothetical protein